MSWLHRDVLNSDYCRLYNQVLFIWGTTGCSLYLFVIYIYYISLSLSFFLTITEQGAVKWCDVVRKSFMAWGSREEGTGEEKASPVDFQKDPGRMPCEGRPVDLAKAEGTVDSASFLMLISRDERHHELQNTPGKHSSSS